MRTRTARYLKAEQSRLYTSGLVLRDPMLAVGGDSGPVVFTGSRRSAGQWCKDNGYFFSLRRATV